MKTPVEMYTMNPYKAYTKTSPTFTTIAQKRELERQVLINALMLATKDPIKFAYNIVDGPGYTAVQTGTKEHSKRAFQREHLTNINPRAQHHEERLFEVASAPDNAA
ncbi:hypothetical protein M0804_009020 [Polistes exclamans]|nr:hypothetical protein M0804_009020 [Polistes exclamans]